MKTAVELPDFITHELSLPQGSFLQRAGWQPSPFVLACAAFDIRGFTPGLFEEYRIPCPETIKSAALKRQAEYLASRWLVRDMADRFGVTHFILTNHNDRSPAWPGSFTASLSHTAGMVFLQLDPQRRLAGNDVEHWMSQAVADETLGILMDAAEKELLDAVSLPAEQATTLLFSVKESLYKALWPGVRRYIDFLQVRLSAIDEVNRRVTLQLEETLSPLYPQGSCFTAQFSISGSRIFTWILPQTQPAQRKVIL